MALGKNLTKKPVESETTQKDQKGQIEVANAGEKLEVEESENVHKESYQQFCVFKSGREEYGIPINLIKEVVPIPKTAPVTQMPSYIIGMANVRGNIFGVLDLGQFFNIKSEQATENKYLLVLEHDVYQMAIAIPNVPDTLMASDSMVEALSASRLKSTLGQKYLKGIIKKEKRMIILFDILGMISNDEFTETS